MKIIKTVTGMTKSIVVLLVCTSFLSTRVSAQAQTEQETQRANVIADSFHIEGIRLYIEFCVKQDAKLYDKGVRMFDKEISVLIDKKNNGTYATEKMKKVDAGVIKKRLNLIDVYSSYFGEQLFKNPILLESAGARTKDVTWEGKEYKLSSDNKGKFNDLVAFLGTSREAYKKDLDAYNEQYPQK